MGRCTTFGSGVLVKNVFPVPFKLKFCQFDFDYCLFERQVLISGTTCFMMISFEVDVGATSEYPVTHALFKSTATVVRGPQSASKVICMYYVLSVKLKCYRGPQSRRR